jgi:multicomponent Na+:H+ antiporter subunit G
MMELLESFRAGVGGLLVAIGLGFIFGGTIGLLRFPDLYTRIHAFSVAGGPGVAIAIVGLALAASSWDMAARLLLLAALVAALGPTLSQLVANAAHAGGLVPLAGQYVAPRPGRAPR